MTRHLRFPIAALAAIAIGASLALLPTGCKTFNAGTVVTPERVRAVAAVGAYYGAKAAILKGHREEMERGLIILHALAESPEPDVTAVINALAAAKISFGQNEEGQFLIGMGAIFFQDIWAPTGQKLLTNEHVRALLKGTIHGATLALGNAVVRGPNVAATLAAEAKATRAR